MGVARMMRDTENRLVLATDEGDVIVRKCIPEGWDPVLDVLGYVSLELVAADIKDASLPLRVEEARAVGQGLLDMAVEIERELRGRGFVP